MAKPGAKISKSDMPHESRTSETVTSASDAATSDEASRPTESSAAMEPTVRAESIAKPDATSAATHQKKELPKPKKPLLPKTGSLLPSPQKLDHLKAAVSAAGSADNLIAILHHVDEAGGHKEVLESIEAYRVLKTVLEEA